MNSIRCGRATKWLGAASLAMVAGLATGCSKNEADKVEQPIGGGTEASQSPINIWWFQWAPADGLQQLGEEFRKETGTAVKVQQIPITSYQDKVFLEFGNATKDHPTAFDIVVGDSQWIGRGATTGLYVDLTKWLPSVVDLKTIHDHASRYLCEYPEGSGKWYAAPCETDAIGLAYRKDWLDDPKEKEAFKAKYHRELAVPDSWDDFQQVAEFFQRPDQKRFGCAMPTHRGYDDLTMGLQNFLWSFGGTWHDEKSNKVKGFLDTPASAAAVDFMRGLMKLGPKGAEKLGYGDVLDAFTHGETAMVLNYFAFFPVIQEQMGAKAGFAVVPQKDGKRIASLGGQGMSISTKISPERQELAKKFIAWFEQTKIQEKWITKPAGFTANIDILKSDAFKKATPYNAPFAASIDTMRDFWNVPCYNELLSVTQQYIGKAIDGEMPTMDALHKLADEKERILKESGLLQ